MSSIILRVRELSERVDQMKADGCDYVELDISDATSSELASIHLECYKVSEPDISIDYEELEGVPESYLP